ncbi:MAG TPA: Ger(x)C family spore germination protein [Bacillota bacterium]|nr:Ger(x)C family spore germination protein [Bacillota bacterium]
MKRRFWLVIIILSITVLPGCWDFQEVDKLSFATTIGVDRGQKEAINVSIQIPIVQAGLPPVITGGKEAKKFFLIDQTADTVGNALDSLEIKSVRSIVFNQAKSVIINEAIARQDIRPVLDHFVRTTQMPLPAFILITDGVTAEDVLKFDPVQNLLPGMMFIYAGQAATKYDMTCFIQHWEFQQKLIHRSKDPYAPLISLDKTHRVYVISDLAVFSGNRMVGKLSGKEVEIFGLLIGVQKSGMMIFNIPGGKITLRNVHGTSKIKVRMKHGKPTFKVNTTVFGSITEVLPSRTTIAPRDIKRFEKIIARQIRNREIKLMKKLQGYNSDIVDFGEEFRVQHPYIWKKTKWRAVYPTVPFEVNTKVKIDGDGRFR